eukprot:CFRG3485T1
MAVISESRKKIAFAIAQFLKEEMVASPDTEDSLEVAVQCLESVYEFELNDVESEANYSIAPLTLQGIFEKEIIPARSFEVEEVMEASAENKSKAEALKDTGNQYLRDFAYEKAIEAYTEAIQLDGTNAVYYVNRAAAHMKLDDLEAAIADCQKGIEVNPAYSKSYGRLGACFFSQQKYAKSIEAYKNGLNVSPDNRVYIDGLQAAETKASEQARSATVGASPNSASDSAGMPGMPGGGGGGMPDLASLMNNPALMKMAQQFMQSGGMDQMMNNPAMREMASKYAGGLGGQPPQ